MFSDQKWSTIVAVIFPVLMFAPVWIGCDDSTSTGSKGVTLSSSAVVAGDCKVFDELKAADGYTPDQDCLVYAIDDQGTLQVTHINAGFNCCPDSFVVEVTQEDGLITFVESEDLTSGGCDFKYSFNPRLAFDFRKIRSEMIRLLVKYPFQVYPDGLA